MGAKKISKSDHVKSPKKSSNLFKRFTLYLYLFILSASFFATYPKIYEEKVFLGGDNAAYYLLGKAIADGEGYVNAHLVNGGPANHYPPGYSFVIGQVLKITGGDIQTIKHLNGFFFLSSILLLFLLIRRLTRNDHLAFASSFFVLFNMHYLMYSSIVMSEMLFSFLCLLALFSFILKEDAKVFYKSPWYYVLILSVILAVYVRTQGVVLVGLWLVWGIWKRNWLPMAAGLLIVFLALLPWQMRSAKLGTSGYQGQLVKVNPYDKSKGEIDFSSYLTRVKNNATRYLGKEIPNAIFPRYYVQYTKDAKTGEVPSSTPVGYMIGILLVLLSVFGAWRLDKWRWFFLIYLGGNLLIFLSWPDVWFGIRFMFAVIPILVFLIFNGTFELVNLLIGLIKKKPAAVAKGKNKKKDADLNVIEKTKYQLTKPYALGFLFLCLIHTQPYDKYKSKVERNYPLKWRNYMDLSAWAERGIPDSSVVACRKPHLFAIQSNKTVSSFPYTDDLEVVLQGLIDKKITHVVVESIGYTATFLYLYPTVTKYKDKFKLIHKMDPEEMARMRNPKAFKNRASTGAFIFEFNPEVGYFGEFDENDKRTGFGKFVKTDGTVFEGNWKNGLLNGKATVTAKDGGVYQGGFVNGMRSGEFNYTASNGDQYLLVFKNDKEVSRTKL